MTKEVLIRISGVQIMNGENDDVEVITVGDYYKKNGKHYIIYDEVMEGFDGVVKNTIKVMPGVMDIVKKGVTNAHMSFASNKRQQTCYMTPFGEMMVDINTNQIAIEEQEDQLKIQVDYSLGINYEHVSECNITVDVRSKDKADFRLTS
ncbi:MAG: DUF1934 domain-containing protein [Lachnospiraceae bacterium]